jgi:hypothetical protein
MALRTLEDIMSYARLVAFQEKHEFDEREDEVDVVKTLVDRVGMMKVNEAFEYKMGELDKADKELWNLEEGDTVYVLVTDMTKPSTELNLTSIDLLNVVQDHVIYPLIAFIVV